MQRGNLPAETHPFRTPPALIFPTCTCQERCSCHLAPSDPLFLRGPSINVKMRQNVAILYLHPHSFPLSTTFFRSYTSLTPLITSLPSSACLPASLLTRFLAPPKALSSSRYHPPVSVASIHPPFHLCRVYRTKQIPSLKVRQASGSRVEGWHRRVQTAAARSQLQKTRKILS